MPNPANLIVNCPACGSPAGESCRTLKTRRTTNTHSDRIVASARIRTAHPSTQQRPHLSLVR